MFYKSRKNNMEILKVQNRGDIFVTSSERNWVFATNSDFKIPISLKPNVVDRRYFKLWILVDQIM